MQHKAACTHRPAPCVAGWLDQATSNLERQEYEWFLAADMLEGGAAPRKKMQRFREKRGKSHMTMAGVS